MPISQSVYAKDDVDILFCCRSRFRYCCQCFILYERQVVLFAFYVCAPSFLFILCVASVTALRDFHCMGFRFMYIHATNITIIYTHAHKLTNASIDS